MMPIHFDNGAERVSQIRGLYLSNHERDLFMYALAGIMALYLEKETLTHCIASAQECMKSIHPNLAVEQDIA